MKTRSSSRRGFTLVELLVVIAIIGILASILFPAINKGIKQANQTKASKNVESVAKSHFGVAIAATRPKRISAEGQTQDWAAKLAYEGGINSTGMYYAGGFQPQAGAEGIVLQDTDDVGSINEDFASDIVAYSVIPGIRSVMSDPSLSALLWTVGDEVGSVYRGGDLSGGDPWGGEGIHVAFVDGHVMYYTQRELNEEPFIDSEDKTPTDDPALTAPRGSGEPLPGGS